MDAVMERAQKVGDIFTDRWVEFRQDLKGYCQTLSSRPRQVAVGAVSAALVLLAARFLRARATARRVAGDEADPDETALRHALELYNPPSWAGPFPKLRGLTEASDFPARLCLKFKIYTTHARGGLRGLDLGCATGATAFEMSKYFDGDVVCVDRAAARVRLAAAVRASVCDGGEPVRYTVPVQGELSEERVARPAEDAFPERCAFFLGDPMDLFEGEEGDPSGGPYHRGSRTYPDLKYWRAKPGESFDGVLCLNVLSRVPNPRRLLKSFHRLLNEGGILVLADPYSWSEEFTDKSNWIGGKDGVRSEDAVEDILSEELEKVYASDEPFFIRNHIRLYQLQLLHCGVWRKKLRVTPYKKRLMQHDISS